MNSRRSAALILLMSLALVAGACGARGASKVESEGGSTTTAAKGASASTTWGDLPSPCGEGQFKVKDGEGGAGTDKLYIGVANDRGSDIRPGLNKEFWDAAQAFAGWCNAQGGIGGLKIEPVDLDAKLFQVEAAMAQACTGVFAMVGGGFVQDDLEFSGKDGSDFHKCGLIDIAAIAVSVKKGLSSGLVQPIPNPPNKQATQWIMDFKKLYPKETKKNVSLVGQLPSMQTINDSYNAAVQAVGGIEQLPQMDYPPTGLSDWTPLAQKVISSGALSSYWVGEASMASSFEAKLKEQGWKGVALHEANIYDPIYFSAGPAAVEGGVIRIAIHPFEEADKWPAIKQYQENLKKYVPDGKEAALGVQGTSAWLLFATAAKACGEKNKGIIDRACIVEQAKAQKDWTGGGIHVPTSPGITTPPECGMLIVAKGGKFTRLYPKIGGQDDDKDGFHCPPDSIVDVPGDFSAAAVDPKRPT